MTVRKKEDLVSIITPVYNSENFIADTIESVLNQTYSNWEMILIDDCSKDNSAEIIKKYVKLDRRLKYKRLEQNGGAAVARNNAIKYANGKYLAFLDSDDLWKANKLERQISFMQKNDIAFSFTSYEVIKEDGTFINRYINVPNKINYKDCLKNTIIGCLTVVMDREKIGDFSIVNIRNNQDTATWLKILKKGYIAYGLNENLALYRLVNGSVSNNKLKAAKSVWKTFRNIENLSLTESSYYFSHYMFNALKKRL